MTYNHDQGALRRVKCQGGMASLLLAAALCSLMAFVALAYTNDSLGRKESVKNNFESSRAELNLTEAIHQFRAFFESIDTNNVSNLTSVFQTGCINGEPNYQTIAGGFALPLGPDRISDGLSVQAIIGNKADPCTPPTPEDWKVYFKAEGNFDCVGAKATTCARRIQFGEIDSTTEQPCVGGSAGSQICTTETRTCDTSGWQYSFKQCSQMAYEWKLFNKGDGGRGRPFNGLAYQKSLSDSDLNKLWKAPVTVTGDVINATPVNPMEAEGLKTAINVSFSENALFFGKELPPYGYFQPVEIGGGVISRPVSPKAAGVAATTDVYLNVYGTSIGGNGRLADANSPFQVSLPPKQPGKALENYNWLGFADPTDPAYDGVLSDPAVSIPLRSQGSLFNPLWTSLNASLGSNADGPLGYFTGRATSHWKEVMTYNFPGNPSMNSLWTIEKAQENLASVIANNSFSGGNDDEKTALRKMAAAYYYFDANANVPKQSVQVMDKSGQLINRNLIVGAGAGYYFGNSSANGLPPYPSSQQLARNFSLCLEKFDPKTWDFERSTGDQPLSCIDPLEKSNQTRFNQLLTARQTYKTGLDQIQTWKTQILDWQAQSNVAQLNITAYNAAVAQYKTQIASAQAAGTPSVVNQLNKQLDAYLNGAQANWTQWNNTIAQMTLNISGNQELINKKTAKINADWTMFMDGPAGYRQDYIAAKTNVNYLDYVTKMRLIGLSRRDSLAAYTGPGSWIGDYLNNPVNKGGSGCLNDNKVPCTSNDYSWPQAMADNAVVLIDARGSGVYLKNLRYVSAQLIVVLGDLYAEDVVLNSNLIVLGDLYLVGRGLAVAPRRWWGVPLQRQCTANLEDGVWNARQSMGRRTVNSLKFPGVFDPRFLGNVRIDACVTVRAPVDNPSICQVPICVTTPPIPCEVQSIQTKSRMSLSSKYFKR